MKAKDVENALLELGSEEKAATSSWFFKTNEGQYGFGDEFIGVTVPEQRKLAKSFKDLPLNEIQKLLNSKKHECRLTALIILVNQFHAANPSQQKILYDFYLSNTKNINNWDLVDASCELVGTFLLKKSRAPLYKLAKSKNLWERRIAMVSTFTFIKNQEFDDTIKLAKILINDEHDLMHKAVGWMLREMGKRDLKTLTKFLNENAQYLPRTALRYAIEKYPENVRKKYLAIKKVS